MSSTRACRKGWQLSSVKAPKRSDRLPETMSSLRRDARTGRSRRSVSRPGPRRWRGRACLRQWATSVRSPHHLTLIAGAVKSRLTRSGAGGAALSGRVSQPRRDLVGRATRPWRAIDTSTLFFDTRHPSATRVGERPRRPIPTSEASNDRCTAHPAARRCSRRAASQVGPATVATVANHDSLSSTARQETHGGRRLGPLWAATNDATVIVLPR